MWSPSSIIVCVPSEWGLWISQYWYRGSSQGLQGPLRRRGFPKPDQNRYSTHWGYDYNELIIGQIIDITQPTRCPSVSSSSFHSPLLETYRALWWCIAFTIQFVLSVPCPLPINILLSCVHVYFCCTAWCGSELLYRKLLSARTLRSDRWSLRWRWSSQHDVLPAELWGCEELHKQCYFAIRYRYCVMCFMVSKINVVVHI